MMFNVGEDEDETHTGMMDETQSIALTQEIASLGAKIAASHPLARAGNLVAKSDLLDLHAKRKTLWSSGGGYNLRKSRWQS